MNGLLSVAWLSLTVLLAGGCLMVPGLRSARLTPKIVTPASARFIHVGITARGDVLHALGAPDYATPDERVFAYSSAIGRTTSLMLWTIYGAVRGSQERIDRTRIDITFDEHGVSAPVTPKGRRQTVRSAANDAELLGIRWAVLAPWKRVALDAAKPFARAEICQHRQRASGPFSSRGESERQVRWRQAR